MYLVGNKDSLFQWDLNQQVKVEDEAIKEVHFTNASRTNALVVEVKDSLAAIPNILLQEAWDIKAYGFSGEYVIENLVINVIARAKPDSYIYTETEVKRWEAYDVRLSALEENLTGYATKDYVNKAIEGIQIPDLSNYALKSEIPDTSNFALKSEIPDHSQYALKSEIPDVSSFMDADEVAAAINEALGVIENGTY